MPLILILAFVVAAYLTAAPDPVTLRATRGAAGAARAAIRAGRPRSTPARSTPRSRSPRSVKAPPAPPRPASRIGAAIRGGIRSADRAEARRGDLIAAAREWRDRRRQRRQAARIRRDEDQAHDENNRRDRAAARGRIRAGVKQIADQIPELTPPPKPDPRPNGGPMPDLPAIPTTELQTLDELLAEVRAVRAVADQIAEATKPLVDHLHLFGERIKGATDLPKTPHMESSFIVIEEIQAGPLEYITSDIAEKWGWLESAIVAEQNRLKEIGPSTGRLENVSS